MSFQTDGEIYVALANQKNYISLHMVPLYVYPELRARLDACGKKCKAGKGCINFLHAEELPLEALAEIIGTTTAEDYKQKLRQLRSTGRPKKQSAKA